jgi:alkylation response protein AidB-like acyl-CoA dehydrogenase
MSNYLVDERDLKFVLYEQLGLDKLTELDRYTEHSKELYDMVIEEARKLAVDVLEPAVVESDKEGCRLENGNVYVPKCFHNAFKLYGEGGWVGVSHPVEVGGQGLPLLLGAVAREYFNCNFPFLSYTGLTEGAAHLIANYGTDRQKKLYMEKMFAGQWAGTMVLTEPAAGSDVGALKTSAKKNPDGTYSITGTKIFITGGDHDLAENIVHAVLARIEGAPAGTKGISIFIVPKYKVNEDGSLGERNDYNIGGIEHKMGINGSATCLMNFGDNGKCYAELLGEENQGMMIMFLLMNEARIGVGMQGLAAGSRAYLYAVKYAKERLQGSDLANFRNPEAPRVPIINHPDVRRMLLWMKSHVESLRAMLYYTARCEDLALAGKTEEEREKWHGVLEIMTPIVKSWGSDVGFWVADQAIQVHGGYGYTKEYPVEQILRDVKIAAIYEGTNGIQSLDLVGRKLGQKGGKNFMALMGDMYGFITAQSGNDKIKDLLDPLKAAVDLLAEIATFFVTCGKEGNFLVPVGNAYPFLNMMAHVISAYMLVWQASIAKDKLDALAKAAGADPSDWGKWAAFIADNADAAYYVGKVSTAKYFIFNVLPRIDSYATAIKSKDMSIMEIPAESFAS